MLIKFLPKVLSQSPSHQSAAVKNQESNEHSSAGESLTQSQVSFREKSAFSGSPCPPNSSNQISVNYNGSGDKLF